MTPQPCEMPAPTGAIEREVAAATDGLLSLNLADVAAAGWKKYEALRQAALRTRNAPATEEIVAPATHRIESSHHPQVEVWLRHGVPLLGPAANPVATNGRGPIGPAVCDSVSARSGR